MKSVKNIHLNLIVSISNNTEEQFNENYYYMFLQVFSPADDL